jgi:hypothetical protein
MNAENAADSEMPRLRIPSAAGTAHLNGMEYGFLPIKYQANLQR